MQVFSGVVHGLPCDWVYRVSSAMWLGCRVVGNGIPIERQTCESTETIAGFPEVQNPAPTRSCTMRSLWLSISSARAEPASPVGCNCPSASRHFHESTARQTDHILPGHL
jgi:hypothetical protein